jgi:hypothetical protein
LASSLNNFQWCRTVTSVEWFCYFLLSYRLHFETKFRHSLGDWHSPWLHRIVVRWIVKQPAETKHPAFGQSGLRMSAANNQRPRMLILEDDPVMLCMVGDYFE